MTWASIRIFVQEFNHCPRLKKVYSSPQYVEIKRIAEYGPVQRLMKLKKLPS
jgi:hypothetical protein